MQYSNVLYYIFDKYRPRFWWRYFHGDPELYSISCILTPLFYTNKLNYKIKPCVYVTQFGKTTLVAHNNFEQTLIYIPMLTIPHTKHTKLERAPIGYPGFLCKMAK